MTAPNCKISELTGRKLIRELLGGCFANSPGILRRHKFRQLLDQRKDIGNFYSRVFFGGGPGARVIFAIPRTFVRFGHSKTGCKYSDEKEIDVEELNVAQVGSEVVTDHHRNELGQRVRGHVLEDAEGSDQGTATCHEMKVVNIIEL